MATRKKVLFVDDEEKVRKYFERFVGPLAEVLTAGSVEEGKAMLKEHGSDIAVLVTDQRMPGETGSDLLKYACQHNPDIVRILTTAYSELGVAIDAINSGEIYRYLKKPWETDSLLTDLRGALDLFELRTARKELEREKLFVKQSQLIASRLAMLYQVTAAVQSDGFESACYQFTQSALMSGNFAPEVTWSQWRGFDLIQAEAAQGVTIGIHLRHWLKAWGSSDDGKHGLSVLAQALTGVVKDGDGVVISDASHLTGLLTVAPGQAVTAEQCIWLAWLLWQRGRASVTALDSAYKVTTDQVAQLPKNWLSDAIEIMSEVPSQ